MVSHVVYVDIEGFLSREPKDEARRNCSLFSSKTLKFQKFKDGCAL